MWVLGWGVFVGGVLGLGCGCGGGDGGVRIAHASCAHLHTQRKHMRIAQHRLTHWPTHLLRRVGDFRALPAPGLRGLLHLGCSYVSWRAIRSRGVIWMMKLWGRIAAFVFVGSFR